MMSDFSPAALSARINPLLDGVLRQQRLVGAVVLVRHGGQEVYRRAAGLLDREAGMPMRDDALFRLASVSKPIVSTAALALVGQQRLGLDDRVTRWLPYFAPRQPDGSVAPITVRHLLTHTAGLDYGFFQPPGGAYARAGVSDGMDASRISLEDNLRRLATVPLAYAPGTRWAYSIATDVLGAVIEAVTGLPLAQAVQQLVTAPLAFCAAGVSLANLLAWQPQRTLRVPLLWILHLSYAWIGIGFALLAVASLGWLPASAALHALTAGSMAGLIIGMMTRTTLGHTGRPLKAGRGEAAMYWLIQLGALARLLAAAGPAPLYVPALLAAGLCWSLAFTLFALAYAPYLWRARVDGRAG